MGSRLTGHGLRHEGWAYIGTNIRATSEGAAGPGMAKCECGAMSEMLRSRSARKRWHAQHKDELRAEQGDGLHEDQR